MNGKIILLTGVSGSGKTTLQNLLIEKYGYVKPLNCTTRKPRSKDVYETDKGNNFVNKELDEYLFYQPYHFELSLRKGLFADFNIYNGNYYGILNSSIDYSKDNCIIVDPIGLIQFKKKFLLEGKEFISVFLDISEEEQEHRLGFKRRESVETITQRKKDFLYFKECGKYDLVLDGEEETELIAMKLLNHINNNDKN